jgi:hypothetical protein
MRVGSDLRDESKRSTSPAIPRIIHQTGVARSRLRDELTLNMERIKQQNPGWEHRYYDDDDVASFVLQEYGPRMLSLVQRIKAPPYGAVRADLFRYLLMYKCGGVYLDIKSRPLRPLDEILRPQDRYLLAQWDNQPGQEFAGFGLHPELRSISGGEYQQWHILAAPAHPFLEAVIERVSRNLRSYNPALHGTGQHGVLRVSGPIAYSLTIDRLRARHPHRLARSATELGLCYSIYDGLAHWSRWRHHYADAREPLMHLGRGTRVAAAMIEWARKAKASLLTAFGPR